MIPLRFFRDKTHVYINNPDGTTKKMTIAEFEAMLEGSGGGGSDIPEHSSSNQGEVLSVDSNGDLVWTSLPPVGGGLEYAGYLVLKNKNTSAIANGSYRDCGVNDIKEIYDKNGNVVESVPSFDIAILVSFYTHGYQFGGYQAAILPSDAPSFQYAPTMRIYNNSGNSLSISDGELDMEFSLYAFKE